MLHSIPPPPSSLSLLPHLLYPSSPIFSIHPPPSSLSLLPHLLYPSSPIFSIPPPPSSLSILPHLLYPSSPIFSIHPPPSSWLGMLLVFFQFKDFVKRKFIPDTQRGQPLYPSFSGEEFKFCCFTTKDILWVDARQLTGTQVFVLADVDEVSEGALCGRNGKCLAYIRASLR